MSAFAVIGLGRFGSAVALELMEAGGEVLAVDIEEKPVEAIADRVTDAVVADARDAEVLKSLGIANYECAVVCMGSDVASSILITLTLKELGVPRVVCKAGSDSHKKALEKVGADWVLIPEREMAERVAQSLASPKILDYVGLLGDIAVVERKIPERWIGRQIMELKIREKYNAAVIAIHRGGEMLTLPQANSELMANDLLILIGRGENLERIDKLG